MLILGIFCETLGKAKMMWVFFAFSLFASGCFYSSTKWRMEKTKKRKTSWRKEMEITLIDGNLQMRKWGKEGIEIKARVVLLSSQTLKLLLTRVVQLCVKLVFLCFLNLVWWILRSYQGKKRFGDELNSLYLKHKNLSIL